MRFFKREKKEKREELGSEIAMEDMDDVLNSFFNGKLSGFARKAERLSAEIDQGRKLFSQACSDFDKVSAEPQMDFIMRGNPNYIKGQKSSYVATLLHAVEQHRKSSDARNVREQYSAELASLEKMLESILKINGQFKNVVMAYPKHLDRFKRLFPQLQQIAASLKAELDKTDAELSEFNDVRGRLYKLGSISDEIEADNEEIAMLEGLPAPGGSDSGKTAKMVSERDKKSMELDSLRKKREGVSSGIVSAFMGLGKAARMYDHGSSSKQRLELFVGDPLHSFANEDAHALFRKLIADLRSTVESGKVQVKNKDEVLLHIARAESFDVYGELSKLGLLEKEEEALVQDKRAYEKALLEIEEESTKSRNRMERIGNAKNKIMELQDSAKKEKTEIESLVFKYYGKRVKLKPDAATRI